MALTDRFVKKVKAAKPAGEKYTDGNGMYLLVTPFGKYWRLESSSQTAGKTAR